MIVKIQMKIQVKKVILINVKIMIKIMILMKIIIKIKGGNSLIDLETYINICSRKMSNK
jgi:hypothetical protein